jgi:hypothetical protein
MKPHQPAPEPAAISAIRARDALFREWTDGAGDRRFTTTLPWGETRDGTSAARDRRTLLSTLDGGRPSKATIAGITARDAAWRSWTDPNGDARFTSTTAGGETREGGQAERDRRSLLVYLKGLS